MVPSVRLVCLNMCFVFYGLNHILQIKIFRILQFLFRILQILFSYSTDFVFVFYVWHFVFWVLFLGFGGRNLRFWDRNLSVLGRNLRHFAFSGVAKFCVSEVVAKFCIAKVVTKLAEMQNFVAASKERLPAVARTAACR